MAYIINKRDGTVVTTVADGTIDTTSTSITLLGKGYNNYGELVAEALVQMIEHFASGDLNGPENALRGQLWYDINDEKIKVNTSNIPGTPNWVSVSSAIVQATAPSSGFDIGGFWYDTTNNLLNISLDGTSFIPLKTFVTGPTAPIVAAEGDLFYDTNTKQLKVYNANLHGTASPGFDVVGPARHTGPNEPTSDVLDGDTWFDSTNKQLYIYDDVNAEFRLIGPDSPGGTFSVSAGSTGIVGVVNNGTPILEIVIDDEIIGIWSPKDFTPSPAISGFPTLLRGLNLSQNAGIASEPTLFGGDATGAFYADLAERYAVDGPVEVGDLVSIGGEAEITKTTIETDINVFGVVSTDPGLKLNAAAGDDKTHPYIAMTGRVPCKVVGLVKKGQRLVSSDIPGVAKAIDNKEVADNFVAVFGRALETNTSSSEKTIEVIVGVK